jgi:hypothetical protein
MTEPCKKCEETAADMATLRRAAEWGELSGLKPPALAEALLDRRDRAVEQALEVRQSLHGAYEWIEQALALLRMIEAGPHTARVHRDAIRALGPGPHRIAAPDESRLRNAELRAELAETLLAEVERAAMTSSLGAYTAVAAKIRTHLASDWLASAKIG